MVRRSSRRGAGMKKKSLCEDVSEDVGESGISKGDEKDKENEKGSDNQEKKGEKHDKKRKESLEEEEELLKSEALERECRQDSKDSKDSKDSNGKPKARMLLPQEEHGEQPPTKKPRSSSSSYCSHDSSSSSSSSSSHELRRPSVSSWVPSSSSCSVGEAQDNSDQDPRFDATAHARDGRERPLCVRSMSSHLRMLNPQNSFCAHAPKSPPPTPLNFRFVMPHHQNHNLVAPTPEVPTCTVIPPQPPQMPYNACCCGCSMHHLWQYHRMLALANSNHAKDTPASSTDANTTNRHNSTSQQTSDLQHSIHADSAQLNIHQSSSFYPPSITTPSTLSPAVTVEQVLADYVSYCSMYSVPPNAGVMAAVRFRSPTIRVGGHFHDADMLALSELLLHHCCSTPPSNTNNTSKPPPFLGHVRRLDFSVASLWGRLHGKLGFTSHGAVALSKVLACGLRCPIQELRIPRNRIGPHGAAAIFRAIGAGGGDMHNSIETHDSHHTYKSNLRKIDMRRCRIGERGASEFVKWVVNRPNATSNLVVVDLSCNRIGFLGTTLVLNALFERNQLAASHKQDTNNKRALNNGDFVDPQLPQLAPNGTYQKQVTQFKATRSPQPLDADLQGNLVFQEIMNSVTHGLGIILCIVGAILLTRRARHQPTYGVLACAVYSTSLLVLYVSSTLFHGFFALRTTRKIFAIFDHCAIYILIAGSYTPYLGISLRHKPIWSVLLLSFIWFCSLCGVFVEAFQADWNYRGTFSLTMYLGLGWACVVCLPDLVQVLPREAIILLVLGGLAYTGGVPFFVRNENLDHSIWHLFVLAASMFHWFGVYNYVSLLPEPEYVPQSWLESLVDSLQGWAGFWQWVFSCFGGSSATAPALPSLDSTVYNGL